jgi:S1-C subfamily serine protease
VRPAAAARRVACATALAVTALPAAALTPAEVYALVAPSVWRVQTYDVDGLPLGLGSAVVVDNEALATNCHVLARAKKVVVRHEKMSVDARLDSSLDPSRAAARPSGRPGIPAPPRAPRGRPAASSSAPTCTRSARRVGAS